jgi:type 1 glutamine amidotransferase
MPRAWWRSWIYAACLMATMVGAPQACAAAKQVLVVTVTLGFRHGSIPIAEKVLAELGQKSGAYIADFARVDPGEAQFQGPNGKPDTAKVEAAISRVLAQKMSASALSNYDAVIFANTTGELPLPDRQAFLEWLRLGKGFVGVHAATDTLHEFQPYLWMIGAEFAGHDLENEAEIVNEDPECPACRHLPTRWRVFDEIYEFQKFEPRRVRSLLAAKKAPNGPAPVTIPVSWSRTYGRGRVFYTSLGHRDDIWDPHTPTTYVRKNSADVAEAFQQHILVGIKWVLRLEDWDAKQPTKSTP